MFSCEYCKIFKSTYFEEHLQMTASYFMKKNRHSWRRNNLSKKKIKSLALEIYESSVL